MPAKQLGRGAQLRAESARSAVNFQVVDANRDGVLSFSEFLGLFPPSVRERFTDAELHMLFDAVDVNGDGNVRGAEFFIWSLRFAQGVLGVRLEEGERALLMQAAAENDGAWACLPVCQSARVARYPLPAPRVRASLREV